MLSEQRTLMQMVKNRLLEPEAIEDFSWTTSYVFNMYVYQQVSNEKHRTQWTFTREPLLEIRVDEKSIDFNRKERGKKAESNNVRPQIQQQVLDAVTLNTSKAKWQQRKTRINFKSIPKTSPTQAKRAHRFQNHQLKARSLPCLTFPSYRNLLWKSSVRRDERVLSEKQGMWEPRSAGRGIQRLFTSTRTRHSLGWLRAPLASPPAPPPRSR